MMRAFCPNKRGQAKNRFFAIVKYASTFYTYITVNVLTPCVSFDVAKRGSRIVELIGVCCLSFSLVCKQFLYRGVQEHK